MHLSASTLALSLALLFNASVQAETLPSRWVSAGGALTEWVAELGGEAKLVGVDTTSQHPEKLSTLPSIGYQRQLSAEGVLSLRPDILVGTDEMGPPPVLAQIQGAGVKIERFSSEASLEALRTNLQHLGALLGDEGRASRRFDEYRQQLSVLKQQVDLAQTKAKAPGVLLLLGHAGSKPMVAGVGTAADWLLTQAGGRNLATSSGYKNFSLEALAALNPDVIVFADRALTGDAARAALLKENPALVSTRALQEGRLIELDPTLLVGGLGPRLPQSLKALTAAFYPTAALKTAP